MQAIYAPFHLNPKKCIPFNNWMTQDGREPISSFIPHEIRERLKTDIGKILRELCERKGIEIITAECCPDHIHMLICIPPKYSVSEIVGYLKGKSSLKIFDRHANLKYKYGNRHFWCRGYYVDTVGKNTKKIREYINNQLKEDWQADQISLSEYINPFTGEPVKRDKS